MRTKPLHSLLTLALLAMIWGTAWLDFRTHTAEHRDQFEQLGAALVGASEGVLLRLCRGGRYDPQELQVSLDELRTSIGAEGLALSSSTGQAIVESGRTGTPESDEAALFQIEFVPPEPRGQGRHGPGPPGLVALPASNLELGLVLSTDSLNARLAGDRRRSLGLAGALSLALLLLMVVLGARERSAALATDLLQTRERLQSLEFLRRLGAGLAHETRTPLGVLRGFAQQLAGGDVAPERIPQIATTIMEQADRTVSRLDEFLLLSRPANLQRETFELRELLVELGELLQPDLDASRGTLQLEHFTQSIHADREQTRRLFMNLMLNAVQALDAGGTVQVEWIPNSQAVRVSDDGPGVPSELLETLFEPYATRREGGTGLGLAIVQRIANEHGWQVSHAAIEPHGAAFTVEGLIV